MDRWNQKRFGKLKAKDQHRSIKRRICSKWAYSQLKNYLRPMNIRYGGIAPVAKGVLDDAWPSILLSFSVHPTRKCKQTTTMRVSDGTYVCYFAFFYGEGMRGVCD